MSAPVGARTTKDVPGNAPCGAVNVKSSKARRTAAPEGFWVVALTCKSNSESGLAQEGAAKFDLCTVHDVRRRLPERLGELRDELAAGGARDRVGRAQLRLDERRRRTGPRRDGPTDDGRGLDGYLCGNQPVRRVLRWRGGRRDDSARTRREILTTQTVTVGYAGAVAT